MASAVRRTLGILALALLAGMGGLVLGSVVTGNGPPPWLTDRLMRSGTGQKLAQWWIDATAPAPPPGVSVAKIGDLRPNPPLMDISGQPRSLDEWNGKRVLVNFWASWCGPCREEMPALDAVRKELSANGVEIVGIALDDAEAVRAFLAEAPVSYPILLPLGGGGAMVTGPGYHENPAIAFGNTRGALPYSVLVGPDGKILRQRLGGLTADQLHNWLESKL